MRVYGARRARAQRLEEIGVKMLLWLVVGIFLLKVVWNLGLPYELLRRRLQKRRGAEGGISIFPALEIVSLALAVLLSSLSTGESWLSQPGNVFWWGLALIVSSYLHLIVATFLTGYLVVKPAKPTEDESLEAAFQPAKVGAKEHLERARRLRAGLPAVEYRQEDTSAFKEQGRS